MIRILYQLHSPGYNSTSCSNHRGNPSLRLHDFDVYEDTFAVTVGLEKQAKSGIAEALAPQIVS